MKIITVSREFGSGGRELAKRLADALKIAYYDREIILQLAKECSLSEDFVARAENVSISSMPLSFARSLSFSTPTNNSYVGILAEQHKLIRNIAQKEDCVIVGRGADAILSDLDPFKIFVYADMPSKVARCRSREETQTISSEKELVRKIKEIDKARAKNHALVSSFDWGDKNAYSLCINTSNLNIKSIIPLVAQYSALWFENKKEK